MTKLVEVTIPFSGFYESIHSELLDNETLDTLAFSLFDAYIDELNEKQLEVVQNLALSQSSTYWDKYRAAYAEAYAKEWCNRAEIKYCKFIEVDSPRFYNFSTDRLVVGCDYKSLQKLRITHLKEFSDWATKNITTVDGFILFSEYHPEMWVNSPCRTWDANKWGMFLSYLEKQHLENIEFEVYEELWANGEAGNCLPRDELNLIDKCNGEE